MTETVDFLYSEIKEGEYYKIPRKKLDLSLCSIEYILIDKRPVILLFCRDQSGEDYIIPDKSFRPYFYCCERDAIEHFQELDWHLVDFPAWGSSEDIVKVYALKPSEVKIHREKKDPSTGKRIKTWEADILFPNRYLIDRAIFTGLSYDPKSGTITPREMPSNFRKIYVDIEVHCPKAPDPVNVPDPIIIIGIFDSFSKEYTLYSTEKVRIDLRQYLLRDRPVRLIYYRTERDLLNAFVRFMSRARPDVFLSFTPFDWLYLFNRMEKLGIEFKEVSRVGVVQIFGKKRIKVHGLQFLDLQRMYYQVFLRGSKWETLDAIAEREINYPYKYPGSKIYQTWTENPSLILIKNLRDVEKIRVLDEELALFSYFDSIRRTIGSNLVDTFYKSRIADIMYLRLCHNKLALPTREYKKKREYKGGVVFPVKPGIYHNIAVFDWSALYPSIMRTFNISFETLVKGRGIGENIVSINDRFFFSLDQKGFAVQLLERLIPLRAPYKIKSKDQTLSKKERLYFKAVSDGIKAVINAIYGVFGHAGHIGREIKSYRLYHPDVAGAVTYVGRVLLEEGLKKICEDLRYDVLYADTDSIFLQLKRGDKEEIEFLQSEISSRIHQFIKTRWNIDPAYLEISLDSLFKTLILFTKKRYIGKTVDGMTQVKGLEIIRKDTAAISALAQELIANSIFENRSREEIISSLIDFVQEFYQRPLEEIAIGKILTKDILEYETFSVHLKAFLWSCDQLGFRLEINKRFWMAYIKDLPKNYDPDVCWINKKGQIKIAKIECIAWDDLHPLPEDLRECIDFDLMLEKTVYKKIEPFLNLLEIDWKKDILSKIKR